MHRLALIAAMFAAWMMAQPAAAQDVDAVRTRNALSDLARAQRDQADSLRSIERTNRDAARQAGRDRQNAEVLSRSARRFDR